MNRHERRRAKKLGRKSDSFATPVAWLDTESLSPDIRKIFGGEDNLTLSEELIQKLIREQDMKESDVRDLAAAGAMYCSSRNSFVFPTEEF